MCSLASHGYEQINLRTEKQTRHTNRTVFELLAEIAAVSRVHSRVMWNVRPTEGDGFAARARCNGCK